MPNPPRRLDRSGRDDDHYRDRWEEYPDRGEGYPDRRGGYRDRRDRYPDPGNRYPDPGDYYPGRAERYPDRGDGYPDWQDEQEPEPPAKRRSRAKRVALIVLVVLAVLGGTGVIGGALYLRSVESGVKRVDAFDKVPQDDRPHRLAEAKGALNFLLLGSDTRDPGNTGGSRSDTIMLIHLNKDHSAGQVISIPRDTWTYIPQSPTSRYGNTEAKINAAYAWGGVPLTVQTVERFTGVRIDHVLMVDFAGFKEIIDALGGVEINVEQSFTSTHSLNPDGRRQFTAGRQLMDGATALDYARERYAFADGDFARIRHQQQVIIAVLNKAAAGGMMTNPAQLNSFLRATTNAVAVDNTFKLFDMAMQLRHLRGSNLTFYTSPTRGTGTVGSQSVVFPDLTRCKAFYAAIRADQPVPAGTKPN